MDQKIMEVRTKRWIPLIAEQANSGLSKKEWCSQNGIERTSFFRWQKRVRSYLLEHQESEEASLPVLKQNENDEKFVELLSPKVALAGAYNTQRSYPTGSYDDSSIRIHYGGFSISLSSGVIDERQLSSVLRVLKHVD